MPLERLQKQMAFIAEVDRLKSVFRQTILLDRSRMENDAEHSWHLALMALVLAEHADAPDLDISRVLKMVLVHDLVEIDAGDTYAYDEEGYEDKEDRETVAAERIFNLLPEDQAEEFRALWDEFEAVETAEARFAAALDRLQPLFHNYRTEGQMWQHHGVHQEPVLARNSSIKEGSEFLWDYARALIKKSVDRGYLAR